MPNLKLAKSGGGDVVRTACGKKKKLKKKKGQLGVSNPVRSRDFLFLFLFFFSFLFFVYFFLFFFRFFLFWTDGWGLEADLRPEAG